MFDLRDQVWRQVKPEVYITRRQYLKELSSWDVAAIKVNDKVVAATIIQGPELHYVIFDKRWRITREVISQTLDPLLAKYGFVTTRTPKDDSRQQRFNELLGFKATGEDEFYIHYRKESVSCQQQP